MVSTHERAEIKRCFIITPIGSDQSAERRHANMIFEVALKNGLEEAGFSLERADLITEPGQITTAIFAALNQADLCIADLTFLNANVMYELGVRHALQKPVIQIAVNGTRLPFDAANQRTLFFDSEDVHSLQRLGAEVIRQVKWIEDNPDKISNPLTSALGMFENAVNADPQAALINQLDARLTALELEPKAGIAAGIMGQGELATKNTHDLRRLWLADIMPGFIEWTAEDGDEMSARYRGYELKVRPESKGRWSSFATEASSGYSVPWPIWQASIEEAKATIIRAVDAALAEREG